MSRPPRAENGEVANKVIPVRMTESEYAEVKAKQGDLSRSEFMRRAALDEDIPQQRSRPSVPEVNRQTYQELHHIGVNLNQQAKVCHRAVQQGQEPPIEPAIIEALAEQVKQVQLEVVGVDADELSDDDSDSKA